MRTVLSLALALFMAAPAAADEIYKKDIDGWLVSCYQNEGRFTHCAAGTVWEPTTSSARRRLKADGMIGSLSTNGVNFGIVLGAEQWRFTPENSYRVSIEFSTGAKWDYTMISKTVESLRYIGEIQPRMVEAFVKSTGFKLWINGTYVGGFKLNGSANAIGHMFGATQAYAPVGGGETFPSRETFEDRYKDTF